MDNYLSHRWPAATAPQPETGKKQNTGRKPPKLPKAGKGRRVWRDVLIIAAAFLVLAGLVAGSFFGVQYVAERLAEEYAGSPGQDVLPAPGPTQENLWSPELLPQGGPDPSVQLELLTREGAETLTATQIYKKVLPSIVVVEVTDGVNYGAGSGVIVSQSGYIITNFHILEGSTATEIAVMRLSDRTVFYDVTLVGYDKELDLAVLKAEGDDFVPAELGSSDELEAGDPIYAIGNPLGYLYGSITDGIVSAVGDRVSQLDYPGRLIQVSAALNSGNSGGALVDAYGRVVGITCAKLTGIQNDAVIEGLGLAIPLSDACSYLNRILRTGDSARPSLGILCLSPVTVDGVTGIQVTETTQGTPAHGKLLPNDLIIAAGGVRVYTVDDMTRILSLMDPGDQVELTVIRGKKEFTVAVGLYDRLRELQ